MSLNEAISEGLLVTGVGLLIVFSVLIILMLALMAMKALFYKDPNKAVKEVVNVDNTSVNAQPAVVESNDIKADDKEIIAVIAAAIAASLNTSVSNLKIKSLKRIGNNSPVWNKAGVNEMINSRL